jgi:hypothetical protein
MLSICSDIDDTTPEEFATYHTFLNTKDYSIYGKGLGLDVGDSMWVFMANDHTWLKCDTASHNFSHILTMCKGTNMNKKNYYDLIKHYYSVGWIDSIHTFGDFSTVTPSNPSFKRTYALNAWKVLTKAGIHPTVWINHGNAANVQNFGASSFASLSYQQGDNKKSKYYHTDITIKNGIKYVWNSIGESSFGFNLPIYKLKLRDGKKVWGFKRYAYDRVKKTLNWTWNPKYLYKQLSKYHLDSLVKNNQYSIVAQHLGGYNVPNPFDAKDITSLKLLKSYQDKNKILISRTSRLLNYAEMSNFIKYKKINMFGKTYINVTYIDDPTLGRITPTLNDLRGLTFYTKNPANTILLLNMNPIQSKYIQKNSSDLNGKKSITIKWFDSNYKNYSVYPKEPYIPGSPSSLPQEGSQPDMENPENALPSKKDSAKTSTPYIPSAPDPSAYTKKDS